MLVYQRVIVQPTKPFSSRAEQLLEATHAAELAHQDQTAEPVEADVRAERIKDLVAVRNLGFIPLSHYYPIIPLLSHYYPIIIPLLSHYYPITIDEWDNGIVLG